MKVTQQSVSALDNPRSALFRIEPDERFKPRCHVCAGPGRYVHSRARKFIRDLSLGEHRTLLQVEYRKVLCSRCGGARMEFLEFVDPCQRVTRRLGAYAAALCAAGLSVEAVAEHLDLDPKTVKHFDKAALEAQYGSTCYEGLERLAIDEIRNEEHRQAKKAGDNVLKGTKYLFLKNWDKLRFDQRSRLREIPDLNERLNTVYWLKDFPAHLWSYSLPYWADLAVTEWCAVAREDGHPRLVRFADTLERYRYGILNHCKHQIHTSKLEGVNNKIKLIKRTAYGFHDLEYFALKVKQAFPGQDVEESLN